VEKVVAHIHKIEATTDLSIKEIRRLIKKPIGTGEIEHLEQYKKQFQRHGKFSYGDLDVYVMANPIRDKRGGFSRKSLLNIVPNKYLNPRQHRKALEKLQSELKEGDVKVSSVELAYDFFTKDPNQVNLLFDAFQKTLFIKGIRKVPESIFYDGGQQYISKKL
jgi:hypothetical protein